MHLIQHPGIQPQANGLYVLGRPDRTFEDVFVAVREKEGRIYSDDVLQKLPLVEAGHPLASEWRMRRCSTERFEKYLARDCPPGPILDLGCGNGWFTNILASNTHEDVLGMDVNFCELEQAVRVFDRQNLYFAYGDLFEEGVLQESFGLIVMNACLQYFPQPGAVLKRCMQLLESGGELHIIDSPLYQISEVASARQRSAKYYSELGFPQMASRYFHHAEDCLSDFAPEFLYRPGGFTRKLKSKLGRPDSPFAWIRIKKS